MRHKTNHVHGWLVVPTLAKANRANRLIDWLTALNSVSWPLLSCCAYCIFMGVLLFQIRFCNGLCGSGEWDWNGVKSVRANRGEVVLENEKIRGALAFISDFCYRFIFKGPRPKNCRKGHGLQFQLAVMDQTFQVTWEKDHGKIHMENLTLAKIGRISAAKQLSQHTVKHQRTGRSFFNKFPAAFLAFTLYRHSGETNLKHSLLSSNQAIKIRFDLDFFNHVCLSEILHRALCEDVALNWKATTVWKSTLHDSYSWKFSVVRNLSKNNFQTWCTKSRCWMGAHCTHRYSL